MNQRERNRAGKRASASREGHELTRRRPRDEDGGRGDQEDPIDPIASHPAPLPSGEREVAIDLTCEKFHGSPPNLHRRFVIGRVLAEPGSRWAPPAAASSQGLPEEPVSEC